MLRSATIAAAALLISTATAQADDAEICRLAAAAAFPNTLDAFHNEMRAQTYAMCMQRRQQPAAAPTKNPDDRPLTAEENALLDRLGRGEIGIEGYGGSWVACTATNDSRVLIDDHRTLPAWAKDGFEIRGKLHPQHLASGWTRYQCWITTPSAEASECADQDVPHGASGTAVDQAYEACMRRTGH